MLTRVILDARLSKIDRLNDNATRLQVTKVTGRLVAGRDGLCGWKPNQPDFLLKMVGGNDKYQICYTVFL